MPKRVEAVTCCVVGLAVLTGFIGWLAVGCGDDDNNDDDTRSTATSSTDSTTTTEPPGSEAADVAPYIEDLLARLDAVTDRIVRDPSVVLDPDSEEFAEFTSLYAPGAEGLTGGLGAFRQSAEEGTHLEPVNAATTGQTIVTGPVVVIDEDTVKVPVCNVRSYRVLDRDSFTLEYLDHLAQPGEAFAVRVDGEWRLERVDLISNTICTEPNGEGSS